MTKLLFAGKWKQLEIEVLSVSGRCTSHIFSNVGPGPQTYGCACQRTWLTYSLTWVLGLRYSRNWSCVTLQCKTEKSMSQK